MPDTKKLTDKAAELAGQAAAAAAPLKDKATDLAGQAAAAAGPLKDKASALAGQAAAAAGPITEQARVIAAQGVDVVAGNLDKITRGKYSDQIHSVASKVEGALDGKAQGGGIAAPPIATDTDPGLKGTTAPLVTEPAPLKADEQP